MYSDFLKTYVVFNAFFFMFAAFVLFKLSADIVKQREYQIFRGLIVTFMVYLITCELWTLQEYRVINLPFPLLYADCFFSLFCVTLCACLVFRFTAQRIIPETAEKRWFVAVSMAPIFVILLCMAVSIRNGMIFTITPDKQIVYRWAYPILPGISLAYILAVLCMSLAKALDRRSRNKWKEYLALAGSMVVVIVCVLIDDGLQDMTILPAAIFAAIFFVFTSIQEASIYTDALTGMNNRRRANEYLESQLTGVTENSPLYLYMSDINAFKRINDEYGHAEGDQALILFADAIRSVISRYAGFAARFGGDEFILAWRPANPASPDPEALVRDIQAVLEQACASAGKPYQVSISAGYTRCADPREPLSACVKAADELLYIRKAEYHEAARRGIA